MVIGVIPARLKSTRFPNKILTPINDKPMVMHVYERSIASEKLDDVIIAIDSKETDVGAHEIYPMCVTPDQSVIGTTFDRSNIYVGDGKSRNIYKFIYRKW